MTEQNRTVPKSLYQLSTSKVSADITLVTKVHSFLPNHILLDVFYETMFTNKQYLDSNIEKSITLDFKLFIRLLTVHNRRKELHQIFQRAYENTFEKDSNIITNIMTQFRSADALDCTNKIDLGMNIAVFCTEGGWYALAHSILSHVEKLCLKLEDTQQYLLKLLECYRRRLYVESSFYMLEEAEKTYNKAKCVVERLTKLGATPNLASLYANFAHLHLMCSEFDEAYEWIQSAMKHFNDSLPKKIVVDLLRHASKACVLHGRFERARMLIEQALIHANELFLQGDILHYCDTLTDYAFYRRHYDDVNSSLRIYSEVRSRRAAYFFSVTNYLIGLSYRDMGYCSYVIGNKHNAREYTHLAQDILHRFVSRRHLALMPAQRVETLMLEEQTIAMCDHYLAIDKCDHYRPRKIMDQLKRCKRLHESMLFESLQMFGMNNMRIADHYDDLARLYCSMEKYRKAENTYLMAIDMRERLFGEDHYEMCVSVSTLATLYSHMGRYAEARDLFVRSSKIKLKQLGDTCPDLGCDYRGLVRVFTELKDETNRLLYTAELHEWHLRCRLRVEPNESPALMDVAAVVGKFLSQ